MIPVGGSSGLGTWGYLEAIEEIRHQEQSMLDSQSSSSSSSPLGEYFTDFAMACGSGGTTAGIALGVHLSTRKELDHPPPRVHAYPVCDDEEYFYHHIEGLFHDMLSSEINPPSSRSLLRVVMAKGLGYALSSKEELVTIKKVAEATGVILDPVYTGKAVHKMLAEMRERPEEWAGRRVLFFHTGGLLGTFDKVDQLLPIMTRGDSETRHLNGVSRLQVPS